MTKTTLLGSLISATLISSVVASANPCVDVTDRQLITNQSVERIAFKTPGQPTQGEAVKYMIQYFNSWNVAAEYSRVWNELVRKKAGYSDIETAKQNFEKSWKTVMGYYDPKLKVAQYDSSHIGKTEDAIGKPVLDLPAETGVAEKFFLRPFVRSQGGSDHRTLYVCVDKNLITAAIHYYAPKIGQKFHNLLYPNKSQIGTDGVAVANYLISSDGTISSLKLTFDSTRFNANAADAGIPIALEK